MVSIVAIPGSLRRGSYNRALLRAAAALAPEDCRLEVDTIEGIPLYHADEETAHGLPAAVKALQDRIAAADALLIATPEYNNAMPGVLKNAIDWLSRPPEAIERVFRHRPVGIIGATPGGFGTVLAQAAWLPVIRVLGLRPWFGARVMVAAAGKAFADDGELVDARAREQLADYLTGFAAFAADCGRERARVGSAPALGGRGR